MTRIRTDATTLHYQTRLTTEDYLRWAHTHIDREFGEDFAREHPELVSSFMQVAAIDFLTAMIRASFQDIAETMEEVAAKFDKGNTEEW